MPPSTATSRASRTTAHARVGNIATTSGRSHGPHLTTNRCTCADGTAAGTLTGTILGTAAYLSPEQSAGYPAGPQTLTFNINISQINGTFFQIDGQPYDGERIDRTLKLGGVDEWTMRSNLASHADADGRG